MRSNEIDNVCGVCDFEGSSASYARRLENRRYGRLENLRYGKGC